ncbi:TFIIA-alpha and beta-like factor [Mobula birostris]|uniref:TFIIA-alpha and beta-like factor n=1 Tax=Mobula birostris TaxID=1983395 RepID=UPI003B28808F
MAYSANVNLVPKLYKSVIEDVINNVHDFFLEEGIDDHILKDLKQLWENKLLQSRAMEGLFRENNHQPIMLELHQKTQALHPPPASAVIPAGGSVQNFTSVEPNSSGISTTLALSSAISLPIQVPAGITLQTASGHMYKVNVPVMVTQGPAGQKYFQQPVHHIIRQVNTVTGQTTLIQQNSGQTHVIQQSSQDQTSVTQQSNSGQVSSHQHLLANQPFEVAGQSILHQPGMSRNVYVQQQVALKQVILQQSGMAVQTGPHLIIQRQPIANTGSITQHKFVSTQPAKLQQSLEEQAASSQIQHSERIPIARTLLFQNHSSVQNEGENISQCASDRYAVQQFAPQVNEAMLMAKAASEEQHVMGETLSTPQLDGTNDTSSDEEIGNLQEVEENDIFGIIDAEDLKALEGYAEDNSSSDESSSDDSDEQPNGETREEDPLNSGDDVSEQEVPDLFDTENVMVCQYDKIHRSKNKWKFYLKDGIMTYNGRDYVFSKAFGDAEW